ncbi:carboxypeptidase regulatory-like domain-containing protein [Pedobacter sp. BS3]|uniref:carboxypeptidase regulatory-like domain-containing protein n=1 Tax=Pedobacter sp. BS3 TaxID=2567937 RepID=UPI0011EE1FB9|nr:carboxypeptidase regulatory-like domain-containing protein [Pedobacter sp. BS3]TZF81496.1 carboxypeptidase regulatory-like domain-containing protein [Pedobacter sp. BS3]
MSYLKSLALFLAFSIALTVPAFSQQDSIRLDSIISKTVKYAASFPQEKVYIQFDKPYYAVGDTVWYKAYLTANYQPSLLSKVLYIDVVNDADSLVQTIKLLVTNGTASGGLPLPSLTYKQGNYHIRAYTNWMLNFQDPRIFTKTIPVGNAINKELVTHISYTSIPVTGGSPKVNARIQFKDQTGKPYINKRVSWKVLDGFDEISKGRGTTDGAGYLTIPVTDGKKVPKAGVLQTALSVDVQRSLSSSFQLKGIITQQAADVQFFPEGGALNAGIPLQVAFKAIKPNGLGVDVKGVILDKDNVEVAKFQSQHLGMGTFILVPQSGQTYKANVTFPDGTHHIYNLPQVQDEGISISVNNKDAESLSVKVIANDPFFAKYRGKSFYIIAQSGGIVCYAAQAALRSQVFTASIPKSKFPSGVAQVTLLTSGGQPLSERLAFIRHAGDLSLNVTTEKPAYTIRQRVKMTVAARRDKQPVEGNFSVAVVDETKVPYNENAETSILSAMLLSSDLKGYIEQPNYYFNHIDAKRLADLDVLMLTQGYRYFSYPDIIAGKYPKLYFMPEQGIEISGTLRTLNGMPVFKGKVRLQVPDKHFSAEATTDAYGKFKFSNLVFPDSSKVIVSAKYNVNGKNMMIMLDNTYAPAASVKTEPYEEVINIDSTLAPYLKNSERQHRSMNVLKEVVITEKVSKKPSHEDYPALTGLSMLADRTLSGDQFTACGMILNCLMTAGLTYADDNLYLTRDYNAGGRTPVQVFVKGMPADIPYVSSLNPAEIESVEVFFQDGVSGINRLYSTNGVVVINMKEAPKGTPMKIDDLKRMLPQSNQLTISPKGYDKARQFYSPKYDVPSKSVPGNDLRTTIYWNPNVLIDKSGNASFEYYNADGRGTYRAIVEGFDAEGNVARGTYRYTVK